MIRENLVKIKQSIIDEPNEKHIMAAEVFGPCNSPSCITGHCIAIMEREGLTVDVGNGIQHVLKYLALDKGQFCSFNAPSFSFASFQAKEGHPSYITKGHVLRFLDRLIDGQENVKEAWKDSRGGEA